MPSNAHVIEELSPNGVSDTLFPVVTNAYESENVLYRREHDVYNREIFTKTNMKLLHNIVIFGVIANPFGSGINYNVYPKYAKLMYGLTLTPLTSGGQDSLILTSNGNLGYCHITFTDTNPYSFYQEPIDMQFIISMGFNEPLPFTIELVTTI